MQARMDRFAKQMDDLEGKIHLFSQGVRTLRDNIINLSSDVDILERLYYERIIDKFENERRAAQMKAGDETARKLNV